MIEYIKNIFMLICSNYIIILIKKFIWLKIIRNFKILKLVIFNMLGVYVCWYVKYISWYCFLCWYVI